MNRPPVRRPIPKRHFLDRSRIKPYPVRHPKPSDWGVGMTVCVAAIGTKDQTSATNEIIVTASDFMISTGSFSADLAAMKTVRIAQRWNAMFAGNDISPGIPILSEVKQALDWDKCSLGEVVAAFQQAYQSQLMAERERRVLATYGLTFPQFLASGLASFGDMGFAELRARIEEITLEIEFLVCGFDQAKKAHIFSICGRDDLGRSAVSIHYHDKPGFYAIGSGQYSALSILYFLGQSEVTKLPATMFNVCAAKFMGERALGVGASTWVEIMEFGKPRLFVEDGIIDDIVRAAWDESGKPRIPHGVLEDIKKAVGELETAELARNAKA
jgi:hypothetical protein